MNSHVTSVHAPICKTHALRPSVRPEGRRRETLCGLLAAPVNRGFTRADLAACATCASITDRHPLERPIDASSELARLRALIDEANEQRLDPGEALHWLATDGPPPITATRSPQPVPA